jgi:hypothetical protein
MRQCLEGTDLPCKDVVLAQWRKVGDPETRRRRWPKQHLLPIAWAGHIGQAPILFIASNPAGGEITDVEPDDQPRRRKLDPALEHLDPKQHPSLLHPHSGPKWWWEPEAVYDAEKNLFDLWVTPDDRSRVEPGERRRKPTKYWQKVRLHAELLLDKKPVTAGVDYALTEVVHCRSGGERGVGKALETCVDLYLTPVLRLSPARLVVVFGDHAKNVLRSRYELDPARVTAPKELEGVVRRLAFLRHPCATTGNRPQWLTDDELQDARRWLGQSAL